jgi:hypothetical protein
VVRDSKGAAFLTGIGLGALACRSHVATLAANSAPAAAS